MVSSSKESQTHATAAETRGVRLPAQVGAPFQVAPLNARQVIERSILAITLIALGIAVLVFLWAVNQFISIWFREQWVPVARGASALVVIAFCLWVLKWLVDRRHAG